MIRLTRINKSALAINADLIKFVESAPDTVITLITGEKVVVTENVGQVIELVLEFRRTILKGVPCPLQSVCLGISSAATTPNQKLEMRDEIGKSRSSLQGPSFGQK